MGIMRKPEEVWILQGSRSRLLLSRSRLIPSRVILSLHETAPDDLKQNLSSRLDELRDCSREGCRSAEGF
jgi:hypothetical protein